jgi:tetratricopeptide (TPR) repeat protein
MTKNTFNWLRFSLFLIGVPILIIFVSSTTVGSISIQTVLAQNTFATASSMVDKGDSLSDSGNSTGALVYYDKALAIDPTNQDALIGKGNTLDDLENYTGSIMYFDKALAKDPQNTDALNGKGFALEDSGNSTGAIMYFDKTLAIAPKDPDALKEKSALTKAAKSG